MDYNPIGNVGLDGALNTSKYGGALTYPNHVFIGEETPDSERSGP